MTDHPPKTLRAQETKRMAMRHPDGKSVVNLFIFATSPLMGRNSLIRQNRDLTESYDLSTPTHSGLKHAIIGLKINTPQANPPLFEVKPGRIVQLQNKRVEI